MLYYIIIIFLVLCSVLQRNSFIFTNIILLLYYKILNIVNFDLKMNNVSK
jgi:hypothetical protein